MEHHFNTDIANEYGIEEAIILHNLFFWISKNAANGKNFYDGSYWTYNSISGYAKLFKYINIDKIRRVIASLVKNGLIKKGNYNDNKMNHTNWYAFTDKGLEYLSAHGYKMQQSIDAKYTERLGQNELIDKGEMHQCITYSNNEDKKQDNNINLPTNVGMSQSDPVDYERLKDYFNEELARHNSVIPKLASVTDRRRQSIKARVREHGKTALMTVIVKAAASAFLNGRNGRAFVASFDWLIKPNNFVKVLEGNYDDNINNITDGNNRSNNGREQRIAEVAAIMDRLMAQDDAERAQ